MDPRSEVKASDSERIRKRLPDYFKALEMPWHLAAPFMAAFVNEDEERLGIPTAHARNLFHVAKALLEESRRATSPEVDPFQDLGDLGGGVILSQWDIGGYDDDHRWSVHFCGDDEKFYFGRTPEEAIAKAKSEKGWEGHP